jgi:hypothetical protein
VWADGLARSALGCGERQLARGATPKKLTRSLLRFPQRKNLNSGTALSAAESTPRHHDVRHLPAPVSDGVGGGAGVLARRERRVSKKNGERPPLACRASASGALAARGRGAVPSLVTRDALAFRRRRRSAAHLPPPPPPLFHGADMCAMRSRMQTAPAPVWTRRRSRVRTTHERRKRPHPHTPTFLSLPHTTTSPSQQQQQQQKQHGRPGRRRVRRRRRRREDQPDHRPARYLGRAAQRLPQLGVRHVAGELFLLFWGFSREREREKWTRRGEARERGTFFLPWRAPACATRKALLLLRQT